MIGMSAVSFVVTHSLPWQVALTALTKALGLPPSAHSSSRPDGELCLRREVLTMDGSIRSRYCRT